MAEQPQQQPAFARHRRSMAVWLWVVCAVTFGMVILGGLTRLTHSGLSMTSWSFTGSLPPLTEAAWAEEFARYQQFPEYQQINEGMTLGEFKRIFFFEYSHRMLGRFIGLLYLLPMGVFLALRAVPRGVLGQLLGILVLLVAQGFVGWWMVKSGLVDNPDVSHYRLTAHLGMAFLFYGVTFWTALSLWRVEGVVVAAAGSARRRLGGLLLGVAGLVYGTALLGGLVAGSNAGFTFNTFPLMGGRLVPAGYLALSPWWMNGLENIAAIQFNHRWVATGTLAVIVGTWAWARRLGLEARARRAVDGVLGVALAQVALGITTLLTVVWLPAASLHQAGALLLLTASLLAAHLVRRPARAAAAPSASAAV